MRPETIAIHGGYEIEPTTKAVAVPIYQTVAYAFDSADHGAALFNLEVEGYRYSRISNPTTAVLERRVAALEGGIEALCVSTGQAAINYAVLNVTELGTNIISVPQLYGTTHTLFAHIFRGQGVEVRFARSDRPGDVTELIDDKTRAVYCESVGNPAGNICDIEALAHVSHDYGIPLIVDNTVATPILLRPIDYGADVVVHSLTKFMRGHARVEWVQYAGFPESPYHALAKKYFGGAACSLMTFGVKGGFEAGKKFYDALKLVLRLVNLGDAKSLACHPASTTHRQMTSEEKHKAGVSPEMIRLSVGIEHSDDIIADLDQALRATEEI